MEPARTSSHGAAGFLYRGRLCITDCALVKESNLITTKKYLEQIISTILLHTRAKNCYNPTSDVFNSKNKELGLWFFFPEFGLGSVNKNEFMFKVPKGSLISEKFSLFASNLQQKVPK